MISDPFNSKDIQKHTHTLYTYKYINILLHIFVMAPTMKAHLEHHPISSMENTIQSGRVWHHGPHGPHQFGGPYFKM